MSLVFDLGTGARWPASGPVGEDPRLSQCRRGDTVFALQTAGVEHLPRGSLLVRENLQQTYYVDLLENSTIIVILTGNTGMLRNDALAIQFDLLSVLRNINVFAINYEFCIETTENG